MMKKKEKNKQNKLWRQKNTKIDPHTGEKRKDVDIDKVATQRKKSKFVRERSIQALREDDLDKITDQFKESNNESFEHMGKQQEESHSDANTDCYVATIFGDHETCNSKNRTTSENRACNTES
jgi:hypothetical protein